MSIINRKRTLRPSNRISSSPYKVNTKNVSSNDTLIVKIDHEDNPGVILYQFEFDGKQLIGKNSIHFSVVETSNGSVVNWHGIHPK